MSGVRRYTVFGKITGQPLIFFIETTLKATSEAQAKEKATNEFLHKHKDLKLKRADIHITHVNDWGESIQDLIKYETAQDWKFFNQTVTLKQVLEF